MGPLAISHKELSSFHAAHFSKSSVGHFAEQFLGPIGGITEEESLDDDGLGYYGDGVKRTLTDEQIAIFRHSEIEALSRQRRKAGGENECKTNCEGEEICRKRHGELSNPIGGGFEEGELADKEPANPPTPPVSYPKQRMSKKEKKIQKAKQMGYFKQNVKPDLRKRTWDKVEMGLGTLDYDEDKETSETALSKPAQRRQISYDE
ncbi:unnamed protein product [Diplocarpon coronariae]|uniref:Uncharacterized protein n=1 Tax=Diplocarpon coronariae TaxID=2795749 RepID=A0A218YU36_9HELO|nr:hypothetical protein JHW43_000500 [Diplocarpon mali]OWO97531.1 hypothetical protein B2J93_9152 [Marssonina coronariae]